MKHLLLLFCLVFTSWQINAQYCTPSVLDCSVGDEIDSFTIPNAGFSHLSTGCSANTYGDFTGDSTLEIDLPVGTTYDFEITHNFGSQFVKIWIDFNSNQTFEDSEIIFTSTAGADPTQGSFTIPGTVTQGSTRMRIIDVFALEPDDPCTPSGTYGETHDYTVNLLPPPACPIPSNVALDIAQGKQLILRGTMSRKLLVVTFGKFMLRAMILIQLLLYRVELFPLDQHQVLLPVYQKFQITTFILLQIAILMEPA